MCTIYNTRKEGSADHHVIMDFEISFIPNLSGDEIPLYFSPSYLLNDGTPTVINNVNLNHNVNGNWYTLDGRRLSGKPTAKGVYINNGNKLVIK